MAAGIVLKARRWSQRLPPAVVTDLPVLALLMLSWVTVAVFWAHLTAGVMLIAAIGLHLLTRRRYPLRRGSAWHRLAYTGFLAAAAAMALTGLLRWAGIPPAYVWHGGVGYLVLVLASLHLWSVRRAVRGRIRSRSSNRGTCHGP